VTGVRTAVTKLRERGRALLADAFALIRPVGRRGPEIVVGVGAVLTVLLALVLVGAARNDAHIDAHTGRAVAEVLDGASSPRTFVRFTADDGAVLTPEKGVFYPRGLQPGQLVRVEYDQTEPELVRVEGRTWTIALVPVLLGVVAIWLVLGPAAWALARLRRRRRAAAREAMRSGDGDERSDGEPEMAGAVHR
jgi:hypothetical protein